MAWVMYHQFKKGQLDGADTHSKFPVDFNTDTLRLLLLVNTSTIDQNDVDVADVIAGASDNEPTETGYARKSITSVTVTNSAGTITVDANDPSAYSQSSSGFNDARYAVLYKFSTADASSPVIASYNFGTDKGNIAGTLTLQFSTSSGIFTLA